MTSKIESMMLQKKVIVSVSVIGAALWVLYRYLNNKKKMLKFLDRSMRDIHIVTTVAEWHAIYPMFMEKCSRIKAIGFDCEWVFWGHRLPVALIQLATYDGMCVLMRVYQMSDRMPETLVKLLADKSILKIGVAVKDDAKKLLKDYGMPVYGCVDLRHILSRVRGYNCVNESLQGLAQCILGVTMVKDKQIRCGDWEADILSQEQISYAADDSLIAVDIFMQLVMVKIMGRTKRNSYYNSGVPSDIESVWTTARSICQGILDVTYKSRKRTQVALMDGGTDEEDEETNTYVPHINEDHSTNRPQKHKNSQKAFMTRQRPLYYNCRLVAPDGTCLTTCDLRKAEWYINKGLGKKISDEPLTVLLNFEPKNKSHNEYDYYLQDKENLCVVCGAKEDYIRRLIVPQEYRKYFPSILKDHSSHDVLLLCISCHLKSADYDGLLRHQLAIECNAPLDSGKDSSKYMDGDLMKVVSAAKALLKSHEKIPASRVQQLETTVKNFYGVQNLSEDLLKQAVDIVYKLHNDSHVPHGKKVVEYYMQKPGGLLEFEKLWRIQFVKEMEPQFLPHLWSVEHRPERLQPVSGSMYNDSESDED